MAKFEIKPGQNFEVVNPTGISVADSITERTFILFQGDIICIKSLQNNGGLITFDTSHRGYAYTITVHPNVFTVLLDGDYITLKTGAVTNITDVPKHNGSNKICYFCGRETEPMFGMLRICRKCEK